VKRGRKVTGLSKDSRTAEGTLRYVRLFYLKGGDVLRLFKRKIEIQNFKDKEVVIMKAVTKIVFVLFTLFVLFGLASDALAEKPKPVEVTNDEANPVPVTGETTVSGSVSIEGTANVNIEGTPDVNVVNDASNPVPVTGTFGIDGTADVYVDNSDSDPIPVRDIGAATLNVFLGTPVVHLSGSETVHSWEYSFGEEKLLVMEFVSVECVSDADNLDLASIRVYSPSGTVGEFDFLMVPQGNDPYGRNRWVASQVVRIYSYESFRPRASRTSVVGALDCHFTITGYTLDRP
jgi:hypothetical protein